MHRSFDDQNSSNTKCSARFPQKSINSMCMQNHLCTFCGVDPQCVRCAVGVRELQACIPWRATRIRPPCRLNSTQWQSTVRAVVRLCLVMHMLYAAKLSSWCWTIGWRILLKVHVAHRETVKLSILSAKSITELGRGCAHMIEGLCWRYTFVSWFCVCYVCF